MGEVTWSNNFVAFMDNLLQTLILQEDNRSLYVPTSIEKLVIDPMKHADYIESLPDEENLSMHLKCFSFLDI